MEGVILSLWVLADHRAAYGTRGDYLEQGEQARVEISTNPRIIRHELARCDNRELGHLEDSKRRGWGESFRSDTKSAH